MLGADYPFSEAVEVNDWTYDGNFIGKTHESSKFFDPPGSMKLAWNDSGFIGGAIKRTFPAPVDFRTRELSLYVKCPAEMAGHYITIYIMTATGNTSDYAIGTINNLGGWQHFTLNFNGWNPGGTADLAQVTAIYLGIYNFAAPNPLICDIYFESIDFDY